MPKECIVSELEHGRHKSTSSVIPEVLFLGGALNRLFDDGASLTHLLDASHRISLRSTELKQAWLCLR